MKKVIFTIGMVLLLIPMLLLAPAARLKVLFMDKEEKNRVRDYFNGLFPEEEPDNWAYAFYRGLIGWITI